MTIEQLTEEFNKLIEERTELSVKHNAGQLKEVHKIAQVRKKIADIKRRMHNETNKAK